MGMLEFFAVVCVLFGIPSSLYIANLFRGDQANAIAAAPVLMAIALLGWWWFSIWVAFSVTVLSVFIAIGYYQEHTKAKPQGQAKKVAVSEPGYDEGGEVWRGPQGGQAKSQDMAAQIDARTREARKRKMAEFSPPQDNRKNADGEWKLSRRDWINSLDNPSIPDQGRWAKFEYVDSDGVITNREIRHWSKRGAYIEGFCMLRRESRIFRQDRITDWVSG